MMRNPWAGTRTYGTTEKWYWSSFWSAVQLATFACRSFHSTNKRASSFSARGSTPIPRSISPSWTMPLWWTHATTMKTSSGIWWRPAPLVILKLWDGTTWHSTLFYAVDQGSMSTCWLYPVYCCQHWLRCFSQFRHPDPIAQPLVSGVVEMIVCCLGYWLDTLEV